VQDSSPLDVAVYQVAQNIPAGSRVRASAWVSVWMTGVPDPANAGAWLRIGIDPNGGTNPNDGDVVWNGVNASQGGSQGGQGWLLSYTPISVDATATGSAVTVFLRWQQTWGGIEQRAFFDEAALVVLQAGSGSVPDAPAVQPTQPPIVADGSSTTYVVRSGDTLYRIARQFGTSITAIVTANNVANPNIIHAGLTLVIPGAGTTATPPAASPPAQQPASSTTCTSPYVVQRGDTLYRIALRCGTTVDALAGANALTNRNLIFVNQQLVIP
jgi:LysM repeat protein